ncbi:hypothetical protein SCP_0705570 [Sparassis crispa]|uniref:Uncharacterized protein n=1 Tax=Sparassis crispa TaxID=139825 RepID=A0A401GT71_9APHY|nr:hypothetical protein SCP_0705570 [Sparassis crispa]GBE85370.1 hypothetical protein SCP_0705570 [Sparassis crispa]
MGIWNGTPVGDSLAKLHFFVSAAAWLMQLHLGTAFPGNLLQAEFFAILLCVLVADEAVPGIALEAREEGFPRWLAWPDLGFQPRLVEFYRDEVYEGL